MSDMERLKGLGYGELCMIGKAARAAADKETEAFKRGGIMAVQDNWDANVGVAAVEAIISALRSKTPTSSPSPPR